MKGYMPPKTRPKLTNSILNLIVRHNGSVEPIARSDGIGFGCSIMGQLDMVVTQQRLRHVDIKIHFNPATHDPKGSKSYPMTLDQVTTHFNPTCSVLG